MAITSIREQKATPYLRWIEVVSDLDNPVFYIWFGGKLSHATRNTRIPVFVERGGQGVRVDIFDSASDTPEQTITEYADLEWQPVPGGARYRIEQYTGGEWVKRQVIKETGKRIYRARLTFLADAAQVQFRVVTIGADGNESNGTTQTFSPVRNPDKPATTMSYDEDNREITISAA